MLDPRNAPTLQPGVAVVALDHFQVTWVLVGSLALSAYGAPTSEVEALDILPGPGHDNLERLAMTLEFLAAVPASTSTSRASAEQMSSDLWPVEETRVCRQFVTRAGRVNVVGTAYYDSVAATARTTAMAGTSIRACHPAAAHPPHRVEEPCWPNSRVVAVPKFPAQLAGPL